MKHDEFVKGIHAINEECYGDNVGLRGKAIIHVEKYYQDLIGKTVLIPDSDKYDDVIASFPTKSLIVITKVYPVFTYNDKIACDVVCCELRISYKYLCKNYELDINGKLKVASLSISYGEARYIPIEYDIKSKLNLYSVDNALAETSFNLKCVAMRNNFFKVVQ